MGKGYPLYKEKSNNSCYKIIFCINIYFNFELWERLFAMEQSLPALYVQASQ
ncbi:hypothetical protein NEPTK9_000714 [Candidatus Neptunochlamydia vexilliferae]|uniref:Uncharacterized protein n=1 Tax=Candidatus Neptunichlamydia vexilliferae TaxID=1651774 RepID=A0ABS0AYK6_9BACT|nr:hypothetical protein [Candidatus Neptunochlamydia vexilliferae]